MNPVTRIAAMTCFLLTLFCAHTSDASARTVYELPATLVSRSVPGQPSVQLRPLPGKRVEVVLTAPDGQCRDARTTDICESTSFRTSLVLLSKAVVEDRGFHEFGFVGHSSYRLVFGPTLSVDPVQFEVLQDGTVVRTIELRRYWRVRTDIELLHD